MIVKTGSYTGAGKRQRVRLDFVPDLVIIAPADATRVAWKNDTCWHGRTQHFDAQPSGYAIGPAIGDTYSPYRGKGFQVEGSYNTAGVVYHWIAIADNGTGRHKSTSWVGNALNARAIDFTTDTPDWCFIKRDSSLPAQIRYAGGSAAVSGTTQGGTASNYTLSATGVVLTNANEVNQNNNGALGEGIEALAFFADGPEIKVTTYTGDGTASRAIALGHTATWAFVVDGVNDATADTTAHCVVAATMAAGSSKRFTTNALDSGVVASIGSSITLGTGFNVAGRQYAILSFADRAETPVGRPDKRGTRCALMPRDSGRLEFADVSLSGACTIEWYGRVTQPSDYSGRAPAAGTGFGTNVITSLILLGEGESATLATRTGNEFNGGIFLGCTDPDSNGWRGEAIRIVHTDYCAVPRSESSINYYSLNTGIPFPYGRDTHLLVTHDGSGHWRLFIDGKLAKDYNLNLNQATYGNRTNGGAGLDLAVHINSFNVSGSRAQLAEMALYRAAIFDEELSDAEIASRIANAMNGTAYSGPAPLAEYDYTGSTKPTAVAEPNVTHGWIVLDDDRQQDIAFEGGAAVTASSATTTFTNIIPADAPSKRRLVGVLTWDQTTGGTAAITTVTLDGVSCTPIASASEELDDDREWSIRWFLVTSEGGDLVVNTSVQPTAVGAAVWDVSDMDDPEFADSEAKATATLEFVNGISGMAFGPFARGPRLFAMFGREGINQTTVPRFSGEAYYDDAFNVGTTSMVTAASGRAAASGAGRVHTIHGKNTNAFFGMAALALRSPVPQFVSGRITEAGHLEITFDRPVFAIESPGITISGTGVVGTPAASEVLSGSGTAIVLYALDASISQFNADLVCSYSAADGRLFSDDGPLDAWTDEPVANGAFDAWVEAASFGEAAALPRSVVVAPLAALDTSPEIFVATSDQPPAPSRRGVMVDPDSDPFALSGPSPNGAGRVRAVYVRNADPGTLSVVGSF